MVDLGGKAGKRPACVVTRQAVLPFLDKVTVAEITTKGKGYPTETFIGQAGNLPLPSFVQADGLHTVPKSRLTKYSGSIDAATMRQISVKIALALGLEDALGEI